ncbi:hypothetical protein D3C79_646560 [compost metagenome]
MLAYPAGGADRHSALVDHHLAALHQAAYGAGHRQHVLQIGRAVLIRRGADRNEDKLGEAHPLGHIRGEVQAAGLMVGLHHGGEARLEDGNDALFEALDLGRVHIHTGHQVTHLGQHGGLNQPHITYPEYGDSHLLLLLDAGSCKASILERFRAPGSGLCLVFQAGVRLGQGSGRFWCKGCNAALTRTILGRPSPLL